MPKGQTLEERFWDKVYPEPNIGCFIWGGAYTGKSSTSDGGYGVIRLGPEHDCRQVYAHQASYLLRHGALPPPELEIDHTCNNRFCVNPDHLEAVTSLVNTRRIHERGKAPRHYKYKTHCPQGHPYAGDNLYVAHGSRGCIACRRERDRARVRPQTDERRTRQREYMRKRRAAGKAARA